MDLTPEWLVYQLLSTNELELYGLLSAVTAILFSTLKMILEAVDFVARTSLIYLWLLSGIGLESDIFTLIHFTIPTPSGL
jgi:hypothetical protein